VKDIVLHRVNTTNRYREEARTEVVNRVAGGSVRHVTEYRNVRGVNCNCGYGGGSRYEGDGDQVSYRE
jgi:hypothetical protein